MKINTARPEQLIAPCGMNCAVCSRYLAYVNNLKRSQCAGCRPGNKKCSYLFATCSGLNSSLEGTASARFCIECEQYPCPQITRMDDRYRRNYQMSVKDNLQSIRRGGEAEFVKEQYEKYCCPKCGDLLSIHNGRCFRCEKITRLVEKRR